MPGEPPARPVMQATMAAPTDTPLGAQTIGAEALYRQYAPFVASFLRHMGAAEADLDDLLQDVFVIAHRKGGYRPGPAAPRTWLASLAIRVVVDWRRARARRPRAQLEPDAIMDEACGPAGLLEARRSLVRVQSALQALSVEHRAAFVLFELEGETCESISAMWSVPIGTVYSRLHNARRRFLEAYERSVSGKGASERGRP